MSTDTVKTPSWDDMTPEERQEFEEFRAYQHRRREEERDREAREEYALMVDDEVESALDQLIALSEEMAVVKQKVYDNFSAVIAMKVETLGLGKPGGQFTHTFTNSSSTRRVTLGNRTIDNYRDTAEDGISMVKEFIKSLAKDNDSQVLVEAVMRLLARDRMGRIQASRVLQLRKIAEQQGDEAFLRGVRIIEEAYQPTETKTFVKAEYKEEATGKWQVVPLNMTDL